MSFAPPTYLIILYNLVALMSHPTLSNSFYPCLRVPLNRILHPSTFFLFIHSFVKINHQSPLTPPNLIRTQAISITQIQPHANLCPPRTRFRLSPPLRASTDIYPVRSPASHFFAIWVYPFIEHFDEHAYSTTPCHRSRFFSSPFRSPPCTRGGVLSCCFF